jgi:hypothetical protein
MTYDYVHRTHWEIFNFQYPKVLKNWWCDDWITNVYGGKRTKKLKSQEVKHLISATRYQVRTFTHTHHRLPFLFPSLFVPSLPSSSPPSHSL